MLHYLLYNLNKNRLHLSDGMIKIYLRVVDQHVAKPVYGCPLEDHLQSSEREIAYVIEVCVSILYHHGLEEEGLFRIAGSASKLKKLKVGHRGLKTLMRTITDKMISYFFTTNPISTLQTALVRETQSLSTALCVLRSVKTWWRVTFGFLSILGLKKSVGLNHHLW